LIAAVLLVLAAPHPAAALDQVSMQLKWKHQFQFAGYYQALEQGFYRDAGLDVTIREGGPGIDAAETVAVGKVDFGVCTASVLREWSMGRRLVARITSAAKRIRSYARLATGAAHARARSFYFNCKQSIRGNYRRNRNRIQDMTDWQIPIHQVSLHTR
jgi:ABC-type nitrate/sulfonate/bicarbonate transport system substrate-binding protein